MEDIIRKQEEVNKKITNRLKRSEGQIRGVLNMLEKGVDCRDVVIQLSAIRSSVDRAIGVIVAENLIECLSEENIDDELKQERVKEAIDLVIKK